MTKEELAGALNGREYGLEITRDEVDIARKSGLIVIFGSSDDNMEFCGAINDEVGCYDGGTVFIYTETKKLFESECNDDDCPYAEQHKARCLTIDAVWCGGEASWTYETDIPHATFNIYEDGQLYCVGIVFEVSSLVR